MPRITDRLYCARGDKPLYDAVRSELGLALSDWTWKDQFMFALAVGLHSGPPLPFEQREELFAITQLGPTDQAIIDAAALTVCEMETLGDEEKVFETAQNFAHAGIHILHGWLESTGFGSFATDLECRLLKLHTARFESDSAPANAT